MHNTAYSAHESMEIGKLKWYNDERLISELLRLVKKYHGGELYDICCGTGHLYSNILMYYPKVHAVDLSEHMLEYNKIYNKKYLFQIDFSHSDAVEYIRANVKYINSNDLMFKNCLQFLNLSEIEESVKRTCFNHVFVINTINKSKLNFFDLLRESGFNFVQRTVNYVLEDGLDDFCSSIGRIVESAEIRQEMPLVEWLVYHGCEPKEILHFINLLDGYRTELLSDYGLTRRFSQYILQRFEKLYCVGHN